MMFLRKVTLLGLAALLGVATSTAQGSFRPRSPMPVEGELRSRSTRARLPAVVEKEALLSQKSLAVRGGVANTVPNAVIGAVVFALIENGVKRSLKAAGVAFPAQLGGCIFLFAFLLLTEAVNPDAAASIFSALTPGAGLLAKWLPVFFVPGLVMLPLSPSIGSGWEVRYIYNYTEASCWLSLSLS
jgi:hypothetical protein